MLPIQRNDTIIIGANLSALVYSFCTGFPIIYTRQLIPREFDFFDSNIDLSKFGVKNIRKLLVSLTENVFIGIPKKTLWHKLNFFLSINSQYLMSLIPNSINIEEDIIKALTKNGRMGSFSYKKLIIFDDHAVAGLNEKFLNVENVKLKVYDWLNIHYGSKQVYDIIETNNDLIKTVYFYISNRLSFNNRRLSKDAVVISYANENDIEKFEWTDTGVMFGFNNLMKGKEFQSKKRRDKYDKTKYIYESPKATHNKRDIEKIVYGQNKTIDNVILCYDSPEFLISNMIVENENTKKIMKIIEKCSN